MRYHHRALGWLTWSRANKEMQHCWWECELEQPLWKTARESLLKRNICVLHGTAIPLLNIYSTVMCARGHRKTATRMFIITKKWKQFKNPLAAELIRHCSIVIWWKSVHQWKWTDHSFQQGNGRISLPWCWTKEAGHKRTHSVRFYVHKIQTLATLISDVKSQDGGSVWIGEKGWPLSLGMSRALGLLATFYFLTYLVAKRLCLFSDNLLIIPLWFVRML